MGNKSAAKQFIFYFYLCRRRIPPTTEPIMIPIAEETVPTVQPTVDHVYQLELYWKMKTDVTWASQFSIFKCCVYRRIAAVCCAAKWIGRARRSATVRASIRVLLLETRISKNVQENKHFLFDIYGTIRIIRRITIYWIVCSIVVTINHRRLCLSDLYENYF